LSRFEEAKRLRSEGLSIKEIAEKMNIAENTAKIYVYYDQEKWKAYQKERKEEYVRTRKTDRVSSTKVKQRIAKYGLPKSWEKECCDLYEDFLKSRSSNIGKPTRLIDSILLLLCKRKRYIEPKELTKSTRGAKGRSAGKSLHFFRVLEELDGLIPATTQEYITKFFVDNPEYEEFLPKALKIASKLPTREFQGKNPRILASVCIYVSSIGILHDQYRPIITKREVATYFKVTEMGITCVYRELLPKIKDMNTVLSEEEIEWLLSFRKMQLER